MTQSNAKPFWEEKKLEEMDAREWESLCDGCGLCCIVRIEDENTAEVYDTNVICRHYDCTRQGCSAYSTRTTLADGCVQLTPDLVRQFDWLPDSCAYRRHLAGLPLLANHPLLNDGLSQRTEKTESVAKPNNNALDDTVIISVVDKYAPIGLVVNGPDISPEQHLVFPDEFES